MSFDNRRQEYEIYWKNHDTITSQNNCFVQYEIDVIIWTKRGGRCLMTHVPAGKPHDVGHHRGKLDVGTFENFLHAVMLASALLDEAPPVPNQFP